MITTVSLTIGENDPNFQRLDGTIIAVCRKHESDVPVGTLSSVEFRMQRCVTRTKMVDLSPDGIFCMAPGPDVFLRLDRIHNTPPATAATTTSTASVVPMPTASLCDISLLLEF